jgi:transcriptional regulator with XRE-family HTH domain
MIFNTETESLIATLKNELKRQGVTYKDIAHQMELSETSIKRLLNNKNITLPRLEHLCKIAQLDFSKLVKLTEQNRAYPEQLTIKQEQEIIADIRLILVMVCLINHWQFDDILNKYDFKQTELYLLFSKLDKLKVIELLPNNNYKLNLSRNFTWQSCGPIQRFFIEAILQNFLKPTPSEKGHHLKYVWGMLTPHSAEELNRRIEKLVEEFLIIAERDKNVPVANKMSSSLMLLFREDWEPMQFTQLHK